MKPLRLCEYCNESIGLIYCRADTARLCISCDREIHSTVSLFSKHTRSLLCDGCDSSPASIFCETEHSVLCQNCDWESHNFSSLSNPVHNRRPTEGFTGCPSVTELLSILGFEDLGEKKAPFFSDESNGFGIDDSGFGDGCLDLLLWQTPTISSFDDLIISSDSGENYQALGVPPLPKNRNAVCGQHKEEILHQLRKLARTKPDSNSENIDEEALKTRKTPAAEQNMRPPDPYTGCDSDLAPPFSWPANEDNIFQWLNDPEEAGNQASHACPLRRKDLEGNPVVPDKQSNIDSLSHAIGSQELDAQHLVPTVSLPFYPKVGLHDINSQERESAISRYKEKKKSRRYDKHIRYVSRKVRAESRIRIKGRFAKTDHENYVGNTMGNSTRTAKQFAKMEG